MSVFNFKSHILNPMSLEKVIIILGPTSSGKTVWAVKLAQKFNGEIISADSRQVYKGMDIGTGKDLSEYGNGKNRVRHHLIDVADPNEVFSVGKWKKMAEQAIEDILKRGKLPIIVGGTGLYIDSLTKGLDFPNSKPDLKLREEIENLDNEELLKKLKKLDLKTFNEIDKKNRRRVERAIEICLTTGKPLSLQRKKNKIKYDFLQIGIRTDRDVLRKRILERLIFRFDVQGMLEEVEGLRKNGVSWDRLDDFGLEYRFVSRYLRGLYQFEDMREKLYYAISQFAKKQMTWFKRDKSIFWVENYKEAEKKIIEYLKSA